MYGVSRYTVSWCWSADLGGSACLEWKPQFSADRRFLGQCCESPGDNFSEASWTNRKIRPAGRKAQRQLTFTQLKLDAVRPLTLLTAVSNVCATATRLALTGQFSRQRLRGIGSARSGIVRSHSIPCCNVDGRSRRWNLSVGMSDASCTAWAPLEPDSGEAGPK
jgi:hypothetical protein